MAVQFSVPKMFQYRQQYIFVLIIPMGKKDKSTQQYVYLPGFKIKGISIIEEQKNIYSKECLFLTMSA